MQGMYSMRSPAVKRLMKEAQELREPTEQYECHPLEDNLFEWHFTIRGPADSEFESGFYHGRIILPPEYPMKPPSIILLTHNGRFEINKKICLSISGHHPESWQPSWSLRTALLAIIGFMPTHGAGALGSLDYTPEERKVLARRSRDFTCPSCGRIDNILKPVTEESEKTKQEARELASQIDFKDEKEKKAALQSAGSSEDTPDAETNTATDTTESPGATASPPESAQSFPPQFTTGMFPFQMPFPPGPFPQMPAHQPGGNPAAQVPRFPLPFVGPMMHPFFQQMMASGNFPRPGMPGMAIPSWQQTNLPTTVPSSGGVTPSSGTEQAQSNSNSATSEQAGKSENVQNVQNTQNQLQSEAESTTQTTSQPGSTQSEEIVHTDGLRQRHVPAVQASSQATPPSTGQRSDQSTAAQSPSSQPESPTFVIFAVVVICLIALLLFRRIYSMKYFSLLF